MKITMIELFYYIIKSTKLNYIKIKLGRVFDGNQLSIQFVQLSSGC